MHPTLLLRKTAATTTPFSSAHKSYVQSLYRRYLRNSLDWCIRRDIWRDRAIEIRAEFERNRHVSNPRELARVLQQAEAELRAHAHPDPHKTPLGEDGTKWCRNLPPPIFSKAEKQAALQSMHPHD
ncbi:hypothetical protein CBS101457_005907 [Exobasidium rhododendri]|nr:hypothetical protein CBS101457_005907 [Exobasidium rhododendri]